MHPRQTLDAFDTFLIDRGLTLDAVVIGGAALALLGVIARQTKDCDILHPALPDAIRTAASEFAEDSRTRGEDLAPDWLNNGPSSLADVLPAGWQKRLQPAFSGRALILRCLGRMDLLRSKLFALCDRGLDLADCVALAPTPSELENILPWLEQQDGHPDWPTHARDTVADLSRRLGHAV
jgi:hypothetical protein